MSDKRFDRVQQLFLAALELPVMQRKPWLVEQCGEDQALLEEIRSLLKHDSPPNDPLENRLDEVIADVGDFAKRPIETRDTVHGRPSALHVRCPHCHNPIELIEDAPLADIDCPSCGSSFSLLGEDKLSSQRIEAPTIAHFVLLEPVGMGAFGSVWKAHDETLDRIVAIKIPRRGQLSRAESEQFLREAKSTARLKHANIVAVHEVGRDGAHIYIVSDFIDGLPLSSWLTDNALTPKDAAELTAKIALALHHAHEAGVIHRDLKPSNIMMDEAGEPHLVDFGLAKQDAGEITMTADGKILGTPAYMSPEQARGEAHRADCRSDVYSLGVILFELLTGERPFRGDHRMLLQQVLNDDAPSPRQLEGSVPRDLNTICLKCLEKTPNARYATADNLANDLSNYIDGRPISARPISSINRTTRWCRRNPKLAALTSAVVGLLLVVAIGSTWSSISLTIAGKETQWALFDMYTRQGLIAADKGDASIASLWFSNAAILSKGDPERRLASRIRANEFSRRMPELVGTFWHDGEQLADLEVSPSGRFVSTLTRQNKCVIWNADNQHAIIEQSSAASMAWSGDERYLAIGLYAQRVLLFDVQQWKTPLTIDFRGPVTTLKFSPDSQTLAIGGDSVRLWNLADEHFLPAILRHPDSARTMTFSQSGGRLAVGYEENQARVFDLNERQNPGSPPKPFAHGARIFEGLLYNAPLFIDSGRKLATVVASRMYWIDPATGRVVNRLSADPPGVHKSAVSPDGMYLATCGNESLQLWNVSTASGIRLVDGKTRDFNDVSFSPDGQVLVTADKHGCVELMAIHDQDAPTIKLHHSQALRTAKFSGDGKRLVTGQSDGLVKVYQIRASDRSVKQIRLEGQNTNLKLNIDGTKMLVTGSMLWWGTLKYAQVFDVATGLPLGPKMDTGTILTDAAFSPDGNQVITASVDKKLQTWDWRSARRTRPAIELPEEPKSLDFDPSGKKLVIVCATGSLQVYDAKSLELLAEETHGVGAPLPFHREGHANRYYNDDGKPVFAREGKCLTISKDSRWLITSGINWDANVWDLETLTLRYAPLSTRGHLFDASLSADETLLVTASAGEARVWDFLTGELIQTLRHPQGIASASFSADGQLVATAGRDGAARVWDWRSGELKCAPMRHESRVNDAEFVPGSEWIVTSGRDATVRFWESDTGQPLSPAVSISGNGKGISFTPDGRHALISNGRGTDVHILDLDAFTHTYRDSDSDALLRFESLSGHRIYRGGETLLESEEVRRRQAPAQKLTQSTTPYVEMRGTDISDENLHERLSSYGDFGALDLTGTRISDVGLKQLAAFTSLRELYLDGTPSTVGGLRFVKDRSLRRLGLARMNVTDRDLEQITKFSDLEWLDLTSCQITDSGLEEISKFPKLQFLKLNGSPITDGGFGQLLMMSSLHTLDLTRTSVGRDGLGNLKSKSLRNLVLNDTEIGNSEIMSLRNCPQLRSLEVRNTLVTERGVAQLKEALPECSIFADPDDLIRKEAHHRFRASLFLNRQDWPNAIRELRHCVGLRPNDTQSLMLLLDVAWWDTWSNERPLSGVMDIYADYLQADRLKEHNLETLFIHAGWCLLANQQVEYERLCKEAIAQHTDSNDPRTKYLLSRILAFAREPVIDSTRLVEIAQRVVDSLPSKGYHKSALATALMRDGRPIEAIEHCGTNIQRALAHALSGNLDKAKASHAAFVKFLIDDTLDPRSSGHPHGKIARRLMLRETEELLGLDPSLGKQYDVSDSALAFQAPERLLYLNCLPITDAELARRLNRLPELEELHLFGTRVGDQNLLGIESAANLQIVYLGSSGITSQGLERVANLQQLRKLGIENTRIDDSGVGHLSSSSKLEFLNLRNTGVTNASMHTLGDSNGLRWLDLGATQLTDEGLVQLGRLKQLKTLYMAGDEISDSGLKHLDGLSNLSELDLSETLITDGAIDILAKHNHLRILRLSGTAITDDGIAQLAFFHNLRELHIDKTRVTARGIEELQQLIPLCVIER